MCNFPVVAIIFLWVTSSAKQLLFQELCSLFLQLDKAGEGWQRLQSLERDWEPLQQCLVRGQKHKETECVSIKRFQDRWIIYLFFLCTSFHPPLGVCSPYIVWTSAGSRRFRHGGKNGNGRLLAFRNVCISSNNIVFLLFLMAASHWCLSGLLHDCF